MARRPIPEGPPPEVILRIINKVSAGHTDCLFACQQGPAVSFDAEIAVMAEARLVDVLDTNSRRFLQWKAQRARRLKQSDRSLRMAFDEISFAAKLFLEPEVWGQITELKKALLQKRAAWTLEQQKRTKPATLRDYLLLVRMLVLHDGIAPYAAARRVTQGLFAVWDQVEKGFPPGSPFGDVTFSAEQREQLWGPWRDRSVRVEKFTRKIYTAYISQYKKAKH
jgi:hypothetical protein